MYRFYNRNPDNVKTTDCVCRAISTATGLKYEAVNNLLDLTSDNWCCDKLCVCCYHHLLEDILCYKRIDSKRLETVQEVATQYSDKAVIIRVDSHLTSSMYGTVLDI